MFLRRGTANARICVRLGAFECTPCVCQTSINKSVIRKYQSEADWLLAAVMLALCINEL